MTRASRHAVFVPVLWYLAGTLLVPLLNGAALRDGFFCHAAVVLAAAAGVVLLAMSARVVANAGSFRPRRRTSGR